MNRILRFILLFGLTVAMVVLGLIVAVLFITICLGVMFWVTLRLAYDWFCKMFLNIFRRKLVLPATNIRYN